MNIPTPSEFTKQGGFNPFPPRWDRWLSSVRASILSSQPQAGRHVSIDEHPGKGTVINVDDTSSRRPPPTSTTGACCLDGDCSITTETGCISKGGTYQGDGTPCSPNPCEFACDGSVTVHAELIASNQSGTCPSHIDITTVTPGTVSGDYVFDSESTLGGDAVFCSFGTGTMEITNGQLHCVCEDDSFAFDNTFFLSLRLVRVITAGTIEGTPYAVGDWVLLVGTLFEIIPTGGVCTFCIGTFATTWLVFPGTNTNTFTVDGVSVDLQLDFSF